MYKDSEPQDERGSVFSRVLERTISHHKGVSYDGIEGCISVYLDGAHAATINEHTKKAEVDTDFENDPRLAHLVDNLRREGYATNLLRAAETDGGGWSYGDKLTRDTIRRQDLLPAAGLDTDEGRPGKRSKDEPDDTDPGWLLHCSDWHYSDG